MAIITDAPNGEQTTIDWTKKIPLSGDKFMELTKIKTYIDAAIATLKASSTVRVAATGNVTIATGLNNGDTLDGETLVTGDLVLLPAQTAPEENGIYVVGVTPARSSEFDTYNKHPGALVTVQEGTANADKTFRCTSDVGGTLGTTAITFAEMTGGAVSDTAYDATSWNGVTTEAPSKNAVRDKIEAMSAGGGGLVLLEQHTASASATLDFTTAISATYDDYLIELLNVLPATDGANFTFRVSTDGGSSYDTGANYKWNGIRNDGSGTGFAGSGSDSRIQMDGGGAISSNANYGLSGRMLLHTPGNAIYKKTEFHTSFLNTSSALINCTGAGIYASATAVNAFRFLFSSGNITSGIIRVYGIVKS